MSLNIKEKLLDFTKRFINDRKLSGNKWNRRLQIGGGYFGLFYIFIGFEVALAVIMYKFAGLKSILAYLFDMSAFPAFIVSLLLVYAILLVSVITFRDKGNEVS